MVRYIKLSSIIPQIPKTLRKETNTADILFYALQGYRILSFPVQTENKITLLEVKDHKILLPKEIKTINFVTWMCSEPTESCISSLYNECVDGDVITSTTVTDPDGKVTVTSTAKQYLIAHKLSISSDFYNTQYFNRNFIPLKYIQGGLKNNVCDKCLNKFTMYCNETFSVDAYGTLWTSFKDGFLCMDYDTEIKTEDDYLIVDDPDVVQYLKHYVIQSLLEERAFAHEQNMYGMSRDYKYDVDIWFKRARGSIMLKNINRAAVEGFSVRGYNENMLRFLPDNYRNKFEFIRS